MTSFNPSKRLSEHAAALLSPYIKLENEHHDQTPAPSLSVGLWSGNVELNNVEIRPEAIEQFLNSCDDDGGDGNNGSPKAAQIKWKLRRGRIDSVKIQIPWKSLLVGSACSSTKGGSNTERGNNNATCRIRGDGEYDEPACASLSTTINIEGVTLLLGYEIVSDDPLLNALQHQHQNNQSCSSSSEGDVRLADEDHLRVKIRQEKNRILQTAERRLLVGLDPFPPSLMEELHSLVRSSIQSGGPLTSSIKKSMTSSRPSHPTNNDDSASFYTPYTQDTTSSTTTKGYLARMENYLSSTLKSLLWRVFDSLSLSVTHVQFSVVGHSHYDKDHVALLRRESAVKAGGKSKDEKQHHHQQQNNRPTKEVGSKRDCQHLGRRFDKHVPLRRLRRDASRQSVGSVEDKEHGDEINVNHSRNSDVVGKIVDEDPSIWSREGQVEVGVTLDRLDVRPGDSQSDSGTLKLIKFRGMGVFLRRIHSLKFGDGRTQYDDAAEADAGGHTGRNLVWKYTNDDDFVIMPTTFSATCKLHRNVSGSLEAGSVTSSTPPKVEESSPVDHIDTSSAGTSLGSRETVITRRRGKRDKRRRTTAADLPTSTQPVQMTFDSDTRDPTQSLNRPVHSVISITTPSPQTMRTEIANFSEDSLLAPHQLELSLKMGHVRSSLSPRQIFLIHSLSSSTTRIKRGRPQTTIRDACAYDRTLFERTAEEGQSMMAWEDRIHRQLPSMRSHFSRHSTRTLPGVVSSWWKYAYFNVVNEIRQRKRLLGRCSGDRTSTAWSKTSSTLTRLNFDSQSKIRREYIDLYLSAYSSIGPEDEAPASDTSFRLAKMEDELAVERLLLLKHVVRAASVRHAQKEHLTPAEKYYNFFPNSLSIDATDWSIEKCRRNITAGNVVELPQKLDGRGMHPQISLAPSLHFLEARASLTASGKYDAGGHTIHDRSVTNQSHVREKNRGHSMSFSADISGFSLVLCDFLNVKTTEVEAHYGVVDQYYNSYLADDVSTLTGFSDDESKTARHTSIGDTFDPLTQFWSTARHGFNCEPITLMHMAGIVLSTRRREIDAFQPPQLNSSFSVGGISLQIPQQQILFCLGNISGESNASDHSIGVSGQCSSLGNSIVVGPAEIIVDWDWLEKVMRFASINKDVRPVGATATLEYEDLLVRRTATSLEFDSLSLTIPLHNAITDDRSEKQYLIATADHFHVKTVNPRDSVCEDSGGIIVPIQESGKESNVHLLSNQDLLFVLDGFDNVITTQKKECFDVPRNSIRLLRCPISIQIQFSSGTGSCSLEQPHHSSCQSFEVRSPSIHLLISEYRMCALLKLTETVRMTLGNVSIAAPDTLEAIPLPTLPAMSDYVFAEYMKVSIQLLDIHIIPDEFESADDYSVRCQLEDAIASFSSHLSYLDFDYPSQVAIDCISKLFMERACALGVPEEVARKCMEAARANFKSEASAKFFSSSSHADAKEGRRGLWAVNHSRIINRNLTDAPLALSDAFDQVVKNVTRMTLLEFSDDLLAESKFDLGLVAESLVLSRSVLYGGITSQITVESLKIRNRQVNLLKILHPTSVPGETDAALAITVQNRSVANRVNCQDIYFEAGSVESIFSPEAYLDAANACGILFDAVSGVKSVHHPKRPVEDMIVNGCVATLTLVLADKLLPFIECQFQDVTFEQSVVGSQTTTHTLRAGAVSIDRVSESSHPNIISTYASKNGDDVDDLSAFSIKLTRQLIPASGPNEFLIALNGVRIVLLRQSLNEILQYISSPNYGIGLVLHGVEAAEKRSSSHASPAPQDLKVSIHNSSIILPRDSNSVDMVGIEVEEISITREQVDETWSIDKYSFSNDVVSQSRGKVGTAVASSSSADFFFDCIDELNFTSPQTGIQRYAVQIKGANVFTALNPCHVSSRDIHVPAFNANVRITGRAVHSKHPFTVVGKVDKTVAEDLMSRVWEKVNEGPVNLRITVDHAPNLRIMVEDVDDDNSRGAYFAMRMSQFYLLMSIWYSNMKELPTLFPYDGDFVEKASIDPDTPTDWPEYGTSEFVNKLKKCGIAAKDTFEMALCFKNLTWRCFYDHPDYFAIIPPTMSLMQSLGIESEGVHGKNFISIAFKNVVCCINNDEENLQRVGVAATSMQIIDGRQRHDEANFVKVLCAEGDLSRQTTVDLNWGLDCGRHTLIAAGLPMPFQLTVFMTPDLNCLINLGVDLAEATLADLTPIWILLDYFGLYFKKSEYGHPAFEAELLYSRSIGHAILESSELVDNCLNVDFRLWTIRPQCMIPSSSELYVMFEAEGFYYRYKSIGQNHSSQEIVARDLGIVVLGEYMRPSISRGLRQVSGSLSSCGIQTLIEGMSFSLRYDFNASTSDIATNGTATAPYFKVALRMPLAPKHFDRRSMDGIECSNIDAQPFCVPPPLVCKPLVVPAHAMGHQNTSIYFSYDYMKLLLDLMTSFVGPKQQRDSSNDETPSENCFSMIAHVERVKCVISDPVMGMHRPFLAVCLPSLLLTASQLQIQQGPQTKIEKMTCGTDTFNAKDLQASMEVTIFIDHFKLGLTRNWEVFVEPFKCLILYERSASRGRGITFNADCPLHFNISSALIETMDDAIKTFDLLGAGSITQVHKKRITESKGFRTSSGAYGGCHNVTVVHRAAEQLEGNERIAFSLENRTGELLRVHTHSPPEADISSSQTTVVYLKHIHLMPLSFPATETAIKNLKSVEVPFKGDQNATSYRQTLDTVTSHEVDFQIPGFRWVRAVSFDKTGKHFLQLIPRSPFVVSKIGEDWRLKNALHVLTEINSVNGGRRLSIASPFQVINKTDHPIILATDPDPRHAPVLTFNDNPDSIGFDRESINENDFAVTKINPGETHSISFLLIESALRMNGNHLGSIWIRPDQSLRDDFIDVSLDPNSSGLDESIIGFPSRPIQLAKMLHESSVIFSESNGDPVIANQVASGIEISCPVYNKINHSPVSRPFCYVVEVKRSPFVRLNNVNTILPDATDSGDATSPARTGKGFAKNIFSKNNAPEKANVHAPISYSLIIHPPLIIENLLPERGRFELMDATSRNVLWWGSLGAGERVSVFTVGLDAPLLLLVNLGYCRTAVGEGALVHHGGGDGLFKTWNAFQGAMKTSRDRVKKTLSTIAESKDNRGAKRVAMIHTRRKMKPKDADGRRVRQLGFNTENDVIGNSGDGFLSRGSGYAMEDIATELSVVDSLGQRLTLHVDNVLGSGGQRRVTLYSPFWIVNTTEHSLRYKQEKSLSFVAGTVLSKGMDGSKPVDEGHRSHLDIGEDDGFVSSSKLDSLDTIFSGRPGAMSLLNCNADCAAEPALLAALISNDLPLRVLSKLAFMFNFHDVLSLGGSPRLCIQLSDTRHEYTSAWSSAFGLESVGVTQIVGMHCKDGRGLEVSASVSVAPGRLGSFTKIVRICPRYIVVNQLPFPIRLWQDSSILHPNVTKEGSSENASESHKWIFTHSENNTVNQYERLFGLRTLIDDNEESGMGAQTTAHHDACFIATVRPSELVSFHLPDTRLERSLRVDFGPSWYLSPSFAADIPGEFVLTMSRVRDLRMLTHVHSRGAPVYTITLPPTDQTNDWNGELGVFFETEWGRERTLIVKGVREGSYASYFTDIAAGDEMIMIDSMPVKKLTFDEAMKYMQVRLNSAKEAAEKRTIPSLNKPLQLQLMMNKTKKRIQRTGANDSQSNDNMVTLTFITLEERLRRLRWAAVGRTAGRSIARESCETVQKIDHVALQEQGDSSNELLVDMKFLFQSAFVFLRTSSISDPPYRIINRSLHWRIYYRQRACDSHPWQCLSPGESSAYTWEEPLKVKKLSVRVGAGEWTDGKLGNQHRSMTRGASEGSGKTLGWKLEFPIHSFQFLTKEEDGHFGAVKTIKLEEIGYDDKLPCPPRGHGPSNNKKENSLCCQVDTEGSTRVLIVSDEIIGSQQDPKVADETVRCHLEKIGKEISDEEKRRAKIDELNKSVAAILRGASLAIPGDESQRSTHFKPNNPLSSLAETDSEAIETELQDLMDYDEGLFITKRNQVVIEVLEATGLRSSDLNGLSNPYVQVKLTCANKKRHFGSFSSKATRSTYFVEKTLSPQWCYQSFVFDVPEKASSDPRETRRYSLQCIIKSNDKVIGHKFLGQAHVHLRNLKDQKVNVGWYPLMGKLGQSGLGQDPLDRISGSIRLRVQWIYDVPGLLEYYILCADSRLGTLRKSREDMKRQLKELQDKAQQEKELEETFSIARVPALAALHKKKNVRSFDYSLDSGISAKEETPSHHSKVIMGVKQFMGKSKRVYKDAPKKRAECSSRSSIDSYGIFVDRELPVDNVMGASSPRSHASIDDNPTGVAGSPPSILLATHNGVSTKSIPHSQVANARNVSLRWQRWQHYSDKTSAAFSYPLYPSWNISRVFIKNTMKPKRPNINSPTAHVFEQGDTAKMVELLKLPPSAPHLIVEREKKYVCELIRSRTSFSEAAMRSLNSIFNPGGVLTIRPITALNLPESFTGMFVKLRYDNQVQSTVSVDSRVAPVWSYDNDLYPDSSKMKSRRKSQIQRRGSTTEDAVNDFHDIAEMFNPTRAGGSRQYDINVQISPFETSKSLRLSVIGESRGPNVEIGVLNIPLGAALECTMYQPPYIRWFPLKSPAEAVPIEGDMNGSCRPFESEKLNDSMFAEYFAPCIKLALIFQPNSVEADSDYVSAGAEQPNRSRANQYLYVRVAQASAALIDSPRTRELALFSARDADVRYSVTTAKTRLAVAVGNIQLDQQSLGTNTQVPVLLAPTPVKYPQPTVQFLAWKDNIRSKLDMDSYEYVAVQVQEMDLKIEEALLYDVWQFYLDVAKTREARASRWNKVSRANFSADNFAGQNIDPVEMARLFLKQDKKIKRKKIYVKELILGFFKVNLSYFKSSRSSRGSMNSSREIPVNADCSELLPLRIPLSSDQSDRNSLAADDAYLQWSENFDFGVDEMTPFASIISAVLPRISNAPIRFNERIIYHVYESEGDIWKSLRSFYSAESLKQIYKIVGSLDFVGNPTMVLTSFRTGLRDFVLQPSRELKHITKNPSRVGVGVLKGTLSLVSNSASGIFGFASNLGATVGHGATQLTLDEHFQRQHSEQKAAQQRHYDRWKKKDFGHITLMVSRPVSDIVFAVISASTGLLVEPYRGAKEDGLVGFTKGTAIGIIGVVVKPVVGLSDAFSHVMESIHDIAKSVNLLEFKSKAIERYRLPNVFGPQRMLLPFNAVDSRSAQLLLAHPLEKKAKVGEEVIVASEALHRGNGLEHYIVVTTLRAVLFRLKLVDGQGFVTANIMWHVKFDKGARITSSLGNRGHNGYILHISRYSSRKKGDPNSDDTSQHISNLEESTEDSQHESVNFFDNGEGKYSNPGTPKSFNPLGPAPATIRVGHVRPFSATEFVDVNRFAVEGELKHRSQLSRIHNAICCIRGDFNSIIREKYHGSGDEGITSFGPYIFEQNISENREDHSFLHSSLEHTVWKFEPSLFSNVTSNRSLFSSPSWSVDCGMASSPSHPPLPPLPPDANSSLLEDDKQKYDGYTDDNSFLRSQIDSMPGETDSHVKGNATKGQGSFVEMCGAFPFLTRSTPAMCKVDESVSASFSRTGTYSIEADSLFGEAVTESGLSERVRRVEAMLESLVGCESATGGTFTNASSQTYQHVPHELRSQHHRDGEEACGVAYGFNGFNTAPISPLSHVGHVDVQALLKEIEDLKQQLIVKNNSKHPISEG